MDTFKNLYANYYDVMYADKTYGAETTFVLRALHDAGINSGSLLSLGAGTLNYEMRLAKEGYTIAGIDLSPDMVRLGNEKLAREHIEKITLTVGDMRNIPVPAEPFVGALALFNVIAYCRDAHELELVFSGVSRALKLGGVFILDCWNEVAVQQSPPESRWKKFNQNGRELFRFTEVKKREGGSLDLSIELIELEGEKVLGRSLETHRVRGWSKDELERIADSAGLTLIHESVFPDWGIPTSDSSWSLGAVFQKTR